MMHVYLQMKYAHFEDDHEAFGSGSTKKFLKMRGPRKIPGPLLCCSCALIVQLVSEKISKDRNASPLP